MSHPPTHPTSHPHPMYTTPLLNSIIKPSRFFSSRTTLETSQVFQLLDWYVAAAVGCVYSWLCLALYWCICTLTLSCFCVQYPDSTRLFRTLASVIRVFFFFLIFCSYVVEQLRCLGVLRTCEVLKVGMPTRISYLDLKMVS